MDIMKTWQTINGILRSMTGSGGTVRMSVGGSLVSDPAVVEDNFNLFFTSVETDLNSRIPAVATDPLRYVQRLPYSFVCLSTDPR